MSRILANAVLIALFLAVPSAFGAEDVTTRELLAQVDKLRSDFADLKLARADSWMFWMAVFMTLATAVIAGFAVVLPLMGVRQQERFRIEAENLKSDLEHLRKEAVLHVNDIRRLRDDAKGASAGGKSVSSEMNLYVPQSSNASEGLRRLIAEAVDLANQENFEMAIEMWEKIAVDANDNNPDIQIDALIQIGELWARLNNFNEVLKAADRVIKIDESTWKGWLNRGWAKIQLNKNAEAILDLEKARDIADDLPLIWSNLGLARSNLGNFEDAISDYEKAISLDETFFLAWNNIGWAKLNLGQFEGAISDLETALRLEPHHYLAVGNISVAYRATGQFQKSLNVTSEAIDHNPRDSATYNNRGRTYLDMKKLKEARRDIEIGKKLATEQNNLKVLEAIRTNLAELELLEGKY